MTQPAWGKAAPLGVGVGQTIILAQDLRRATQAT